MIEARINSLAINERLDITSGDEIRRERNKINMAILGILDKVNTLDSKSISSAIKDILASVHYYYDIQGDSFIPNTLNSSALVKSDCYAIYHEGLNPETLKYRFSFCKNATLPSFQGGRLQLDPVIELESVARGRYFSLDFDHFDSPVDLSAAKTFAHILYNKEQSYNGNYTAMAIVASPRNMESLGEIIGEFLYQNPKRKVQFDRLNIFSK